MILRLIKNYSGRLNRHNKQKPEVSLQTVNYGAQSETIREILFALDCIPNFANYEVAMTLFAWINI